MSVQHPNIRAWVVSVNTDEDDPLVFGPYTQRMAEALADGFNQRIDAEALGVGYINATATRIRNPQSVRSMLTEFGQ